MKINKALFCGIAISLLSGCMIQPIEGVSVYPDYGFWLGESHDRDRYEHRHYRNERYTRNYTNQGQRVLQRPGHYLYYRR